MVPEVSNASSEDVGIADLLRNLQSKLLSADLYQDWMCALEKQSSKRDWKNWKNKFFSSPCYGPAGTSVLKDGSPASLALGLVTVDF